MAQSVERHLGKIKRLKINPSKNKPKSPENNICLRGAAGSAQPW